MILKYIAKYIPDSLKYSSLLRRIPIYYLQVKQLSALFKPSINLSGNHISLTVGNDYKIPCPSISDLSWVSESVFVDVDKDGRVCALADKLGEESNATVKAYRFNKLCNTYYFTIVTWPANQSSLEIIQLLPKYKLLAYHDGAIYYSIAKSLYATEDGFLSKRFLTNLPVIPASSPPLLVTPKGYFLVGQKQIFWSEDLQNWDKMQQVNTNGVKHSFCYYYSPSLDNCFIYYAEYSCISSNRHKVYRGSIDSEGHQNWDVVLDFRSLNECKNNPLYDVQSARHIHVVSVDKYTGNVWVGVGDDDAHSKILFSTDNGTSFYVVGMGSQEWRTLAIWHTENYTYWNMDSHEPQKIFRINKKNLKTPISNKFTKSIKASDVQNIEPETVAELFNGAMFSICEVQNSKGDHLVLMAASPEGCLRDMQGRVFGIQHSDNLSQVQVQELISVSPKNIKAPYETNMFTQLIPELQDNAGYIYFSTRNLLYDGIIKTKLYWN